MREALFKMFTAHCFFGCGHTTTEATTAGSSDAMERHYWDAHYSQETRDWLHAAGQRQERIGAS